MAKHIEPTGLLIFDGECGFCRRWIRYMRSWFRTHPEAVAWQESDLALLGLTEEQCREAVQFVDAGGRVWSGSDAAAQVLKVAGFLVFTARSCDVVAAGSRDSATDVQVGGAQSPPHFTATRSRHVRATR